MDDQDRAEILAEILTERLPHVRHIVDEWSVAESDALNYAQTKDLIWQLMAPLGLAMIGFKAAERALHDSPVDPAARSAYEQFMRVGSDVGEMVERLLTSADVTRP